MSLSPDYFEIKSLDGSSIFQVSFGEVATNEFSLQDWQVDYPYAYVALEDHKTADNSISRVVCVDLIAGEYAWAAFFKSLDAQTDATTGF